MDHSVDNSSAKSNMTKGQIDCQSQVKDLIEKLSSWRDESHRQMSDIISSHSGSINKGFNDLSEEFSDLKANVFILRKERNVLLETINNLNGEIRQMSARFPLAEPEDHKFDSSEEDITDIKEEWVESPRIHSEASNEEEYIDYGDISDERAQHKNRYPTDDHASSGNELDDVDVNDSVHVDVTQVNDVGPMLEQGETQQNEGKCDKESTLKPPNCTIESTEFVCKVCNFAFSTNENLEIHSKNIHSKLGLNVSHEDNEDSKEGGDLATIDIRMIKDTKMSMHQKLKCNRGDEKLKCEQCPYQSLQKSALKRHIMAVHDKIRNHTCDECGYATSTKSTLKKHWDAVHNMGDKKFKCENCPYSSAQRTNLKYHMISVHNMGDKFKCEKCGYVTAQKSDLKKHITGVHEKIRSKVKGVGSTAKQKLHWYQVSC